MRRERLILLVAGEKYSIVWLSVEAIYSLRVPLFFPLSPRHARPYLTLIPQQPPGRRLIPYHPLIPLRL